MSDNFSIIGLIKSRIVPGNDVDSFMIKVGLVTFSEIVLQAASMYFRSGLRSIDRGVGTAITTTSEPSISMPLLVALYLPAEIALAIKSELTPSI